MSTTVRQKLLYLTDRMGSLTVAERLGISNKEYMLYTSDTKPEPPMRAKIDDLFRKVKESPAPTIVEAPDFDDFDDNDYPRPAKATKDSILLRIRDIMEPEQGRPWAIAVDDRHREVFIGYGRLNELKQRGHGRVGDMLWAIIGPTSRANSSIPYEVKEMHL
jgi:hypothetical protein